VLISNGVRTALRVPSVGQSANGKWKIHLENLPSASESQSWNTSRVATGSEQSKQTNSSNRAALPNVTQALLYFLPSLFFYSFFFWLSKRNLNWMEQTGRSIDYRGTTAKNRSINAKHLSGIISSAYFIESDWKLSGMCGDALIQVDSSQFLWLLFIDGHIEGELAVNWFTGNRKLIDGSSRRTCDSTVNSINSNRSCRCRHRTSGQESRWLLHYFVFIWLGFQLIPAPLIHSELWKWQTNWSWPINRSLSLTRSRLPHHRFNQTRPVTSTGRKTFIYFVLHF